MSSSDDYTSSSGDDEGPSRFKALTKGVSMRAFAALKRPHVAVTWGSVKPGLSRVASATASAAGARARTLKDVAARVGADAARTSMRGASRGVARYRSMRDVTKEKIDQWSLGVKVITVNGRVVRPGDDDLESVGSAHILEDRSGFGVNLRVPVHPTRLEFFEQRLNRIVPVPARWEASVIFFALIVATPCYIVSRTLWGKISDGLKNYITITLVLCATAFLCTAAELLYKLAKHFMATPIEDPMEPVSVRARCPICKEMFDSPCGRETDDGCRGIIWAEKQKAVKFRKKVDIVCPTVRGRCGHALHFHCISRFLARRDMMKLEPVCPSREHEGFAEWMWGSVEQEEQFRVWHEGYVKLMNDVVHEEGQRLRAQEEAQLKRDMAAERERMREEIDKSARKGKRGLFGRGRDSVSDGETQASELETTVVFGDGDDESKAGSPEFEPEVGGRQERKAFDFRDQEQGEEDPSVEEDFGGYVHMPNYRRRPNMELLDEVRNARAIEALREEHAFGLKYRDNAMRDRAVKVITDQTLEPFDPLPVATRAKRRFDGDPSTEHVYNTAKAMADAARARWQSLQHTPRRKRPVSGKKAAAAYAERPRLLDVVAEKATAGTMLDDPKLRDGPPGKQLSTIHKRIIKEKVLQKARERGDELDLSVPRYDPEDYRKEYTLDPGELPPRTVRGKLARALRRKVADIEQRFERRERLRAAARKAARQAKRAAASTKTRAVAPAEQLGLDATAAAAGGGSAGAFGFAAAVQEMSGTTAGEALPTDADVGSGGRSGGIGVETAAARPSAGATQGAGATTPPTTGEPLRAGLPTIPRLPLGGASMGAVVGATTAVSSNVGRPKDAKDRASAAANLAQPDPPIPASVASSGSVGSVGDRAVPVRPPQSTARTPIAPDAVTRPPGRAPSASGKERKRRARSRGHRDPGSRQRKRQVDALGRRVLSSAEQADAIAANMVKDVRESRRAQRMHAHRLGLESTDLSTRAKIMADERAAKEERRRAAARLAVVEAPKGPASTRQPARLDDWNASLMLLAKKKRRKQERKLRRSARASEASTAR